MTWIFFALLGAFFWSLVHHLDKLQLTKFSVTHGIGSLVLFSSLFPALVLPFFLLIVGNEPFLLSLTKVLIFITAGILGAIAAVCYFYALEREETTVVVSMYQLSPVFGYVFGVLFLNETLSKLQLLGALITILGVTLLSLEFFEEGRVTVRKRTTLLMAMAASTYALGDVIYKWEAIGDVSYLVAMFWVLVGYILFGLVALTCIKSYRESFFSVIRNRSYSVLGLNLLNECLQTAGVMFTAYAFLLAPVALVLVIDSYQPILVFIMGIGLTLFFPSLARENLTPRHLIHKTAAIAIAVMGTLLIQI